MMSLHPDSCALRVAQVAKNITHFHNQLIGPPIEHSFFVCVILEHGKIFFFEIFF